MKDAYFRLVVAIFLMGLLLSSCKISDEVAFRRIFVLKELVNSATPAAERTEIWAESGPMIIRASESMFPDVRATAISLINGLLPDRKILMPIVMKAMKDKDADVRNAAAFTLFNIGKDARPAIPLMFEALKDEDPRVQGRAAETLAIFGREAIEAEPVLIDLLNDEVPYVRQRAAGALARIDPSKTTAEHIMELLHDDDRDTRTEAAQCLGIIGDNAVDAIPMLIDMLNDDDDINGPNAAMGLCWYPKIPREYAPALIKALDEFKYRYVREYLVYAVASIGPEPEVIEALIRDLNNGSDTAAYFLGNMGPRPGILEALAYVTKKPNISALCREQAARSMGRLGLDAKTVLPYLVEALNSDSPLIWAGAADGLAALKPDPAPVIGRLKDIAGLGANKIIIPKGWQPDVSYTKSGGYYYEEVAQISAAYAIAKLSPADKKDAMHILINGLNHACCGIRAKAIERLAKFGPEPEIIAALIKTLDDEDENNKRSAAVILGDMGPAAIEALPKLQDLADDYFTRMYHNVTGADNYRDAAREAIEKITGEPYKLDYN